LLGERFSEFRYNSYMATVKIGRRRQRASAAGRRDTAPARERPGLFFARRSSGRAGRRTRLESSVQARSKEPS
jgi:hypothetical protein